VHASPQLLVLEPVPLERVAQPGAAPLGDAERREPGPRVTTRVGRWALPRHAVHREARPGQDLLDDRERLVGLEPPAREDGQVDRGVDVRRQHRPALAGPHRPAEPAGDGHEPEQHALLLADRGGVGERALDAVAVAAGVRGLTALPRAHGVVDHHGRRGQAQAQRLAGLDREGSGERGEPRDPEHTGDGASPGTASAGRALRLGGTRLPPGGREAADGEHLDLVGPDPLGQREQVPGPQTGVVEREARQGRVRTGHPQTSVRWKLCQERDAVGPRWPW
jgi:hypothetical protein